MIRQVKASHSTHYRKPTHQFQLCTLCAFGVGEEPVGFCRKVSATFPSIQTVRRAEIRLSCQNYMVDLHLPYRRHIDWIIDKLRDFKGHYCNEEGRRIDVPGIAPILTPASEWWMRDMIENGKWPGVETVPRLRSEVTGRWRLIAVAIQIAEIVQPLCLD